VQYVCYSTGWKIKYFIFIFILFKYIISLPINIDYKCSNSNLYKVEKLTGQTWDKILGGGFAITGAKRDWWMINKIVDLR
jgi:hypothetical protein